MKYVLECNGMYEMGLDEDEKPVWTSDIKQTYIYTQKGNILFGIINTSTKDTIVV